jgi:hypothetical protein
MSVLSSGLVSPNGVPNPAASLTQGVGVALPQYTAANPFEAGPVNPLAQLVAVQTSQVTTSAQVIANQAIVRDANGVPVAPVLAAPPQINVGSGATMSFNSKTLQAQITPALSIPSNSIQDLVGSTQFFSGSDIRLMIELANPLGNKRYAKQLMECTTLSVAVFRAKDAVRAGGFIGAKGYSRGGRTIAGTLVLTQFSQDVLFEFLSAYGLGEKSKSNGFAKIDQLPPFNITAIFTNEYGYASYRRLTGVEFIQDGTVYSINDAFSEQTISYVASDFTTLMPLTLAGVMQPPTPTSPAAAREKTPSDCMKPPVSNVPMADAAPYSAPTPDSSFGVPAFFGNPPATPSFSMVPSS